MVKSFSENVEAGKKHFKYLFYEPGTCHIGEIMKLLQLVLNLIDEDMNHSLEANITYEEVLSKLSSFKKGKIPRPGGLTVEFFGGFFDLIKYDLVKVVQESMSLGKVLGSLNTTFMALITKKNTHYLLRILN